MAKVIVMTCAKSLLMVCPQERARFRRSSSDMDFATNCQRYDGFGPSLAFRFAV